jgi:sigma-B regulation protein RsbU (phosphoserine phosphatase)
LAPDAVKEKVAGDIARLTRLSGPLKQLSRQYGEGLLWTYASLESGVHVSYPGHGGYPTGYDPRQRPWYQMAKRAGGLTWMPVVDATTRQLTLTVSTPYRYPDGSFAGVVGMDLQIAFALAKDETTAGWSRHMSSFIIALERVAKGDFSVRLEAGMKDERDPADPRVQ